MKEYKEVNKDRQDMPDLGQKDNFSYKDECKLINVFITLIITNYNFVSTLQLHLVRPVHVNRLLELEHVSIQMNF